MMVVLITRPMHDDTTAYLFEWSRSIIDECNRRGIKVLNIEKDDVKKDNVLSFILSKKPSLLVFNGHGDPETIYGHNKEPSKEPILSAKNLREDVVKGRVIHSLSCNSANVLGRECVNKGAISFIGYANEFVFFIDPSSSSKPLQDKNAQPFLESANKAVISIIKGNTIHEAFNNSQASYDWWIEHFYAHYPLEAPYILPWLLWDKMQQTVIGDEEYKVF
jgi:hypothetical protein